MVLRSIAANPLRAQLVKRAEDYAWSSFRAHGLGETTDLLDSVIPYEQSAAYAKVRERKWYAYVHQQPAERELQAIRRSVDTGLPYGTARWIMNLSRKLNLDLTIRPRGRPRKQPTKAGKARPTNIK